LELHERLNISYFPWHSLQ